ncbi:hypothetical protein KUTeg_014018, partial [Tegillarca granosa]
MEEQNEFHFDPEKNYDEATLAQQREIEKQVSEQQALISGKITFDELREEYSKEDEVYLHKLESLKKKYTSVRRTRGDGNCFFRAFGFAFFESLIENLKDFKRYFMGIVNKLNGQCTLQELMDTFNDQGLSDYLVEVEPMGKESDHIHIIALTSCLGVPVRVMDVLLLLPYDDLSPLT